MVKKLLSINFLALLLFPAVMLAQVSISGKVTDATTGEALPGANVLIVELNRGAATSIDGDFRINDVPSGTYTINVSYIGFKTFEQKLEIAASDVELNIDLQPDFLGLDEVVVTGYAQRDKQAFTGKVSTVSADKLDKVPVASIEAALQGNSPGLFVTAATGTPGAVQQIRIRGRSSIGAGTDPLFVIDGVPVENGNFSGYSATSSLGVMANLNPSDIESITILKDAVSTAPYGARGTNGVVVITTKQGKFGNTVYNVKYQSGFSNKAVKGPGALQYDDWSKLLYAAAENRYGLGWTADEYIDALGAPSEGRTNWADEVLNKNASMNDFAISARGGNSQTTFYVSGGFMAQDGAVIGSDIKRYSGKVDLTHQLDSRLKISNSTTGSVVEQNGFLEGAGYFGSPLLAEFFLLPGLTAYDDDGEPTMFAGTFNPLYIQKYDINRKRNYRLLNNTKFDLKILDALTFSSRIAIDYIQTEEKYYRNPYYGDSIDEEGSVEDIANRNFNYVWQNQLNYFYSPNRDNTFGVTLVQEFQRNYYRSLDAYGEGIAVYGLFNLNTTANPMYTGGGSSDYATQATMALLNYSFQEKLFVDLSYRYEGNSRFADAKRWGSFYSVGVGYLLSKEGFIKDLGFVNNLKLRASYGTTGNASVGINTYQAMVGFNAYNGNPSILTSTLGNKNLTWETAKALDLGIDFGIFDRFSGSFTYYNKASDNLLYNVPLSRTTGHTSQNSNIGTLTNTGIELEFNADIIRGNDISWNIGANLGTVKNEITKLAKGADGEDITIKSTIQYGAVKGYAVGQWFMKEWAGVDPANGDPLWYMDDGNGGKTTTNKYALATAYDQKASAIPTLTSGISTRVDAFGFYVSAQLNYMGGYKIFDSWAGYTRSDGRLIANYNNYADVMDFWTPDNPNAKNPKPVLGGNQNSYSASSRYLYKGDHLRLRTLNVGYNLPTTIVRQAGLTSATIFMSGSNLWTYVFDKDFKFDPETGANGSLDLNAQPMKTITFGININF